MKTCPYCAEEIQDDAKKCKHCGEYLDSALRALRQSNKPREIQVKVDDGMSGGKLLWIIVAAIVIGGLLLAFG